MSQPYQEPVPGEVRGPWRTSPGNPFPWMAYCRGPNGWIPFHAKTGKQALRDARDYRDKHFTKEQP